MRVLHLLASPVFSGPAENVALLAATQRALGCEVSIAVDRKRPFLEAEEPIVPRLEAMGLLDRGELELSVKSTPAAWVSDARGLRARNVDVVHAHFSHDHFLARWALAGKLKRVALIRSLHAPRSLRWSLPFAHGYTVPSSRYRFHLPDRRVAVLRARIDPAFQPPSDLGALRRALRLEGSPLVGMVSTFKPSRRHLVGLEAFAQLRIARPTARLVLVGDGITEPATRRRVAELNLEEAVTFAGYRSGPDFIQWLQALDCIWVLGLGNDWSARAAAQARACGVAVLGVDQGALPEWSSAIVEPEPSSIVEATISPQIELAPKPDFPNDDGLLDFYRSVATVS